MTPEETFNHSPLRLLMALGCQISISPSSSVCTREKCKRFRQGAVMLSSVRHGSWEGTSHSGTIAYVLAVFTVLRQSRESCR